MYIAVDDTDSRDGMCTTYLLTEIIRRSNLDVIGHPCLVRLNPAIQYKTRGNGALSVNLGKGTGKPEFLGRMHGVDIQSYQNGEETLSQDEALSLAAEAVEDMAIMDDQNTNPGIVVSANKFPEDLYWKAVRKEVSIRDAEEFVHSNGGKFRKFKNGRGIIGAAASLSWPSKKFTYEILSYRDQGGDPLPHNLKIKVAEKFDEVSDTFNNLDRRNRYPAIFPKERTPVLCGVRGLSEEAILKSFPVVLEEFGIQVDRYACFLTNQGTDDHIQEKVSLLQERQSYSIFGEVLKAPESIKGSHYFSKIVTGGAVIGISAYEPTKEFRETFRKLRPGDYLRIFGTYKEGGINIEKMEVLGVSRSYVRSSPSCDKCGKKMSNKGGSDYRCNNCNTRKRLPHYHYVQRDLKTGKYDVPVIARRHISRPFELDKDMMKKDEANIIT